MAKPIKLKLEDLHFQLTKDNFVKCVYKGKNMYNDHYEVVHEAPVERNQPWLLVLAELNELLKTVLAEAKDLYGY